MFVVVCVLNVNDVYCGVIVLFLVFMCLIGGVMVCEVNGGVDGGNNALIASVVCVYFFDVCGLYEFLVNIVMVKGRFGDWKG